MGNSSGKSRAQESVVINTELLLSHQGRFFISCFHPGRFRTPIYPPKTPAHEVFTPSLPRICSQFLGRIVPLEQSTEAPPLMGFESRECAKDTSHHCVMAAASLEKNVFCNTHSSRGTFQERHSCSIRWIIYFVWQCCINIRHSKGAERKSELSAWWI